MKRLETERLLLRKFKIEDAQKAYKNWAGVQELANISDYRKHESIAETEKIIEMGLGEEDEDRYTWAIVLKDTLEPIGFIRIYEQSDKNKTCKVRWMLGYKWWGKRIIIEALKAVIKYTFDEKDINIIICEYYKDLDEACKEVLDEVKMIKEATLRDRKIDQITGEKIDIEVYSITKQEYEKMTKN